MVGTLGGKHRLVRQAPCYSREYQKTVNNVTNEAFNSNPCIPIVNGYPIEYSCLSELANTTDVTSLTIEYNYEVWINEDEPSFGIVQNIRALEWSILFNVATAISLDKCKLSNQRIPRRLSRRDNDNLVRPRHIRRGLQQSDNTYNSTKVVYLSSSNPNQIKLNTESCITRPTSVNTVCIPVKGIMSAEYIGDNPFAVEKYLQDTVAKEMTRKTILIGDVTSVRYVGDGSQYQTIKPANSSPNLTGVAIGVTTAAFTILLLGLFAFWRRRTPKQQQREVREERVEPMDEEEEEDEDDDPENASTLTDEAVLGGGVTTEGVAVSTDETEERSASSCTSRALPSRPKPTRKKKKRKKQKIVRVSSRTSIAEMETIKEEIEETGESSTYSKTDDTGSVEFQPHDPWIAGPIAPRREPNVSFSELAPSSNTKKQRQPPSPIMEEKKIRRLPPPWV